MSDPVEFTGERFVPGTEGEIAFEHWHRYFFARRFVAGRRVLDVACGEGYGSALLSEVAADVVGVDIDPASVSHAASKYATRSNLRFVEGTVTALPLPPSCVDAIVSFETIEHVDASEQRQMIAEFARVLAPEGVLILSSPNRPEYSEARGYVNPYHRHELDRAELEEVLSGEFAARRWYCQRRYLGSALWHEQGGDAFEAFRADDGALSNELPRAMYFVVIAARHERALPASAPALSLFSDHDEREWRRIEGQVREIVRLDELLKGHANHIRHLEELVAYRERIIVERDAQLQEANAVRTSIEARLKETNAEIARLRQTADALDAERKHLERAIAAQERIIAYRQSARWWLKLPWLRIGLLWKRLAGP